MKPTGEEAPHADIHTVLTPIVHEVTVELPIEQAFRLFTEGMQSWWPTTTHSIAADTFEGKLTVEKLVFEPRLGGRVLERMSDGVEAPWGTIIAWQAPHRFVMTWNPTLLDRPSTEIEVRFTRVDEQSTRVELEHRGWENLVERRDELHAGYSEGWPRVINRYVTTAARLSA